MLKISTLDLVMHHQDEAEELARYPRISRNHLAALLRVIEEVTGTALTLGAPMSQKNLKEEDEECPWESGKLGRSEEHAVQVSPEETKEIEEIINQLGK